MKRIALIALLTLSGCETVQEIFPDVPKQVAVLEASLAAADHTALIYVTLPVCGKTTAVLCRTPDITVKMGAAEQAAYVAVNAARQAETQDSVTAASTAVGALKSMTDSLQVGG